MPKPNQLLRVQVSKRKTLYATLEADTAPNVGGFYVKVYHDENCEFEAGEFTINKSRLSKKGDLHQAEIVASERIRCEF